MRHKSNKAKTAPPTIVAEYEKMLDKDMVSYLEPGDFEEIIEYYEEEQNFNSAKGAIDLAIQRFPFQAGFLLSKASILLAKGKVEEAELLIKSAENLAPSDWEVSFRKAELAAMKGDLDSAITILDHIIDHHKEAEFGMLYLLKGMVYQELADFHNMYKSLKLSLEADPSNDHALHLFWLSVEICQEHEESIEFHQWLIDQEPYSALAWSNLGHAYSCLEQWSNAAEAFEYAYIIDKEFEFAYRDCAIALMKLKRYQQTLDCLEEGMQYFDPDVEVLEQLGTCHIELENFEEARIVLLDGLSLDATSSNLHFLLGRLHLRNGNNKKALVYLKRATQMDDTVAEYFLELARVCMELSLISQSEQYFDEACNLAPNNLELHLEFARFKGKVSGESSALEFLKSIHDIFSGPEINYCIIGIMLNLENRQEGLNNLADALNENFNKHETLLKYFPKLQQDAEVNAIIASYKPLA